MAKQESGFIHWYESYKGKKVTGIIYSAGASVVIIGALFKIMHFPGAGPVLMTGMITESILFMIGVLDKPHVDFHWRMFSRKSLVTALSLSIWQKYKPVRARHC